MIEWPAPASAPLEWLSPSAYEVLRTCPLRLSYARSMPPARSSPTPQRVLGDVCHQVLERLTASGRIRDPDLDAAISAELEEALQDAESQLGRSRPRSLAGPPSTWPGFATKRARLRKAAVRLHALLVKAGPDAEWLFEQPLTALAGRLRGRPDLVVRSRDQHWIVDYKTGPIQEEDGLPKSAYVRQLRLYGVLERAAAGELPSRAYLVPLKGEPLEVPLSERECHDVVEDLVREVSRYNATAPSPQPGSPSAEACSWCPFAGGCPDFWATCDANWAPKLVAARGVVVRVQQTVIGGATVAIEVRDGSVAADQIVVRGISASEHPSVAEIEPGCQISIRGLRPLSEMGTTYGLTRGASIWVLT